MKRYFPIASVLMIFSILMLATGCAASSDQMAASQAPAAYEEAASTAESYDYKAEYAPEAAEIPTIDEGSGLAELPMLTPDNTAGIELSYTVSLHLQTDSFMAGIRKLNTTVGELKGYTVQASIRGRDMLRDDYPRTATYSFQIPSTNLSAFLMTMEDNYNLLQMEQEAEDITTRHQQTDDRLAQLEEQELRLRDSLEATEDPEARADLENQLLDTQSQISSLRASSGNMDRQVRYSSVSVTLQEVIIPQEMPEPTWDERLSAVKEETGIRFLAMGRNLVLFSISALPVLVVLLVLGLIALLIYRLCKRYERNRRDRAAREKEPERVH